MRRINTFLLFSSLSNIILAAELTRPRGVGPDFAKFYKSDSDFSCISNPSISLKLSQVNDDYCDCPDGSDEPGTSACTSVLSLSAQPAAGSLNATLALPGFYCKNKGHIPSYVPHTVVNDGVCDYDLCCDGSDEWAAVGGVKCQDRCKEIGKEWKFLDEIKKNSLRVALKKKAELISQAQALKSGIEISITKLHKEIEEKRKEAANLKKNYEEIERREKGRVVRSAGKGSKVTILAGLAKHRVQELRLAVFRVLDQRNQLQSRVEELEDILSTFKEEYNPNFNDEGVKRAVKAWEDYAASKPVAGVGTSDDDKEFEDIIKEDDEGQGINWAEWETEDESDIEALYKFEEYLPQILRNWLHDKFTDLRIMLIENGILANHANAGTESEVVTNARLAFQSVSDDLNTKETNLGELESDLTKDYGAKDIFRALKGHCVEKDSGEYVYELCWLESTKQKSKKGGGHTGMGNFVRYDTMKVDEEVGADGKGLGEGDRLVLRYENGQNCWNGPNRETTVVLGCAEKDEIWKVVEQEKCLYRMDVGTPAACDFENKTKKLSTKSKDEL